MGQFNAVAKQLIAEKRVKLTGKLARIVVDDLIAPLELVYLLKQGDGYDNIMFLKGVEAPVVIEHHIGIKDKVFTVFFFSHVYSV